MTAEVNGFVLRLDGQPKGKPRARFRPGQKPYPDKLQKLAEGEVRRAWEQAGRPRLPDVALILDVTLTVTRPAGHFKRDWSLSAEGERCPFPHRQKPDLDNCLKLICDALNTLAWRDDVRFVEMYARRVWGEWPGTVIRARRADKFDAHGFLARVSDAVVEGEREAA